MRVEECDEKPVLEYSEADFFVHPLLVSQSVPDLDIA